MSILAFFFLFSWWILLLTIPSFWDKPTSWMQPRAMAVGKAAPAGTALDQDPHCGQKGGTAPCWAEGLGCPQDCPFLGQGGAPSLLPQPHPLSRAAKECQQVSHHNGKSCAEPNSWPWLLQVTQALWHLALALFNL